MKNSPQSQQLNSFSKNTFRDDIAELKKQVLINYKKYLSSKNKKTLEYVCYLKDLIIQGEQQQITYDIVNAKKGIRSKTDENFDRLKEHLKNCGSLVKHSWYCKLCEEENEDDKLLRVDKIYQTCGVRYCKKIRCVLTRFALQVEVLKNNKRLIGLKKMDHFVIGFPEIDKQDFEDNFKAIKQKQERVMNSYFSKLRKKGFKVQAFKVLDFSIKENKIYMHYHFVAIPIQTKDKKSFMILCQSIRKEMLERQRVKLPFHLQFFGLKKKGALFSYLSLRAVGLYKFDDKKEPDYKISNIRKLKDLIKSGKFMFLQDIVSVETYFKNFYNHRHFTTIGGLPYGSIIMDNVLPKFPNFCKKHGTLTRDKIRLEIEQLNPENKPPDPPEDLKIERVDLGIAKEKREFDKDIEHQNKFNSDNLDEKRFLRFCNIGKENKIKLDLQDKLNILAFGKC